MTIVAILGWSFAIVLFATLSLVAREWVRTQQKLVESERERDAAVLAGGMDYERLAEAMSRHGVRISELRGEWVKAGLDKR